MKTIFFVFVFIFWGLLLNAQNVGIGTTNPQTKLHIAGDIRIDALSGSASGAVLSNNTGTLNKLPFTGDPTDVLNGNGAWSKGLQSSSGIVGTKIYNNPALLNAGYSLFGEIPGIKSYSTSAGILTSLQWWPTYTRGIVTNVPAPQSGIAVWSGSLMYVATFINLYSYNPTTDIWTIVSNQGFSDNQSQCIWTGTEIIFWSGGSGNGTRYNPSTNTWVNLPLTNAPSARAFYTMIWDGSRVIIWGGVSATDLNTGAMDNPSTNSWTTMNTSGAPAARFHHTAIWNNVNGSMIIWGGNNIAAVPNNTGGLFNSVSNTWTGATNITGAPTVRESHTAVWTGTEMIIFGGLSTSNQILNTGGKYNPSTNSWTTTSISGASPVYLHAAVWTGSTMFVTGGEFSYNGITIDYSYSYNPLTDLWTNTGGFADGRALHYSFFANNMVLVWGGFSRTASSPNFNSTNTGSRYFLTDMLSSATRITDETLYLYQKN